MALKIADWIVIGCYFLILFVIAIYYRRFAGRSLDEFYLGGRRNSGWSNGLAYAGSLMNADVAPAYSGFAVATGLFVSWFYLSRFGIALFIGAILFAVFWRRLNLFTTPEFYELRFGGKASSIIRSWVALKSSMLAMVAWTATGLLALHKIGGPVLGFEDKSTTMLVVLPIVLTYVFLSGFAGSAATSSIHTLILLVGSAMLCLIVMWQNGGPVSMANQLQSVIGPEALKAIPPLEHGVLPLSAALAWMIGTSIGYGGDTAPLGGAMEGQYLFSSKNAREASKMYVVAEVSLFLLLLLITLPSLMAAVHWPELRLPITDPKHVDREMAYGFIMSKYLPAGIMGLLFVGMLASVMSTIGGNLTFGSQVMINDIYRRYLAPDKSERHYLWAGRAAVVLILIFATFVAFRVELIFDVAAFMVAASVAEMPANWAQWWWWRFNSWGRLTASFGGLIIPAFVWFVLPTKEWEWWNKTYLVIVANMGLTVIVTLLTRPDGWPILKGFYKAAHPLGSWGPVNEQIQKEQNENNVELSTTVTAARGASTALIFSGLALALLGSISVMLMVIGLSYLYLGENGLGVATLAGFALSAIAFFKAYGPYLDRLEQWAPARDSTSAKTSLNALGNDASLAVEKYEEADLQKLSSRSPSNNPYDPPQIVDQTIEKSTFKNSSPLPEPISTDTIVAISMAVYGLLFLVGGIIWTRGEQLTYNLIAGAGFMVVAVIAWWFGRLSAR